MVSSRSSRLQGERVRALIRRSLRELYALLLALGVLGLSLTRTRPSRARAAAVGLTTAGLIPARLTPAALLIDGAVLFAAWRMTRYRRTLAIACGLPLIVRAAYAVSAFGTVFPVSGSVKLEGSILGLDGRFWPGVLAVVSTMFQYVGQVLKLTLGFDSTFWGIQGPASGRPTGFGPVPEAFQDIMLRLALSTNAQPEIVTARIGSSNSGVLRFFSDATVIHLDGLANDDVVWQRRRGEQLGSYAQRNGIAYRIDFLPLEGWQGDLHTRSWNGTPSAPFTGRVL